MGRRDRYTRAVAPRLHVVANLRQRGASMTEIADLLGVSEGTLYKYANLHPELREALDRYKPQLRAKVVGALIRKACGYDHPEQVMAPDGTIRTVVRHHPPDTTAIKYYLATQEGQEWAERQQVDVQHTHKLEDYFSGALGPSRQPQALPAGDDGGDDGPVYEVIDSPTT